ncbi:hypothetical protein CICLE_v10018076mg, partial [Citrus x clementina]
SLFNNLPVTPPLFAYNTLIRAYAKTSCSIESIKLFDEMLKTGLRPDNFTYPLVVKACGRCLLIGVGGSLHSLIFKVGLDSDKYIGNTLLRMYAACKEIDFGKALDSPSDALKVFHRMNLANENPNCVTLVSLVSACTSLINVRAGESIQSYAVVNGLELDVAIGTALVEMYSKCGHVEKAFKVFNLMREKNLHSWTIMISGLADNSRGNDAISLFAKMIQTGLKPDSISFYAILSACRH